MVIALVGLIFILLLVFVLIIRGQSKKYAKKSDSGERLGGHPWGDLGGGLPGMQEEQNARGMGILGSVGCQLERCGGSLSGVPLPAFGVQMGQ